MESPSIEPAPRGADVVARHRDLLARSALVAALTLLSRGLGFVREALMAAVFGDRSFVSDAFYTAWRVPNLFRRLLGEGALSTALQTAMTRLDVEAGDAAGRTLFQSTLRWLGGVLVVVTPLAMLVMLVLPDEAPLFGGAWLGPAPAVVRDLTARVLPYVPLVCVAAVCGGALAVRGHFAIPNLAPTLMNLVWIGALVAIGMRWNWGRDEGGALEADEQWTMARWLVLGLLLGGTVQLAVHWPPLARHGLLGRERDDGATRTRVRAVLRDSRRRAPAPRARGTPRSRPRSTRAPAGTAGVDWRGRARSHRPSRAGPAPSARRP